MPKIFTKVRRLRLQMAATRGTPVTLQEVSEATGIDSAALSRIESGKTTRIDFDTLQKLCVFYGVGVGDVLEFDPNILKPTYAEQVQAAA